MITREETFLAFEETWPKLVIPGEFDCMDATDQERWRSVLYQAFAEGARWVATKQGIGTAGEL